MFENERRKYTGGFRLDMRGNEYEYPDIAREIVEHHIDPSKRGTLTKRVLHAAQEYLKAQHMMQKVPINQDIEFKKTSLPRINEYIKLKINGKDIVSAYTNKLIDTQELIDSYDSAKRIWFEIRDNDATRRIVNDRADGHTVKRETKLTSEYLTKFNKEHGYNDLR